MRSDAVVFELDAADMLPGDKRPVPPLDYGTLKVPACGEPQRIVLMITGVNSPYSSEDGRNGANVSASIN